MTTGSAASPFTVARELTATFDGNGNVALTDHTQAAKDARRGAIQRRADTLAVAAVVAAAGALNADKAAWGDLNPDRTPGRETLRQADIYHQRIAEAMAAVRELRTLGPVGIYAAALHAILPGRVFFAFWPNGERTTLQEWASVVNVDPKWGPHAPEIVDFLNRNIVLPLVRAADETSGEPAEA